MVNMNEMLVKAITMGRRSGGTREAFKQAWKACGGEKECGTWNNSLRQFNAAMSTVDAAAAAQQQQRPQPKTPPKKAKAAAASLSSAGASAGATTQTRTGTLQAPTVIAHQARGLRCARPLQRPAQRGSRRRRGPRSRRDEGRCVHTRNTSIEH
jgi:uncharacterized membrane protein